jgi:hypothetical protein
MANTPIPYEPEFFCGHEFSGTVEVLEGLRNNVPIPAAGFSRLALKVLVQIPGVAMMADLEGLSEKDILSVRGCGPQTLKNIQTVMGVHGYSLQGNAEPMLRRVRKAAALISQKKYGEARDLLADVYPELADACERTQGNASSSEHKKRLPWEQVRPRMIFRLRSSRNRLAAESAMIRSIKDWVYDKYLGTLVIVLDKEDELDIDLIGEWHHQPVVVRRDRR